MAKKTRKLTLLTFMNCQGPPSDNLGTLHSHYAGAQLQP